MSSCFTYKKMILLFSLLYYKSLHMNAYNNMTLLTTGYNLTEMFKYFWDVVNYLPIKNAAN